MRLVDADYRNRYGRRLTGGLRLYWLPRKVGFYRRIGMQNAAKSGVGREWRTGVGFTLRAFVRSADGAKNAIRKSFGLRARRETDGYSLNYKSQRHGPNQGRPL
jgi:hypothetical protein